LFSKNIFIFFLFIVIFISEIKADKGDNNSKIVKANSQSQISFKENKGQVSDQNYRPRPDILFSGTDGQLVFHIKNNGISYQLGKVDKWKKQDTFPIISHSKNKSSELVPEQITTYRLDVNWLNSNSKADIIKGEVLEGYDNFYLESCPQGALEVKSYKQITFQKLYNGIDLKWYEKSGRLKYDYIVAAGADYKQIQLEINGAENISVNKNGELIIKTPLGDLIEQAPIVKQNGQQLTAKWTIKNNIISFEIEKINSLLPLIIDPLIRLWGTYYGGNGQDEGWFLSKDLNNNVYTSGHTKSNNSLNIATVGAQQTTYSGGGSFWGDAFITKFNSAGVRLWATYYGGSGQDFGCRCITDASENVFFVGGASVTNSAIIATPGAHQTNYTGGGFGNGTDDAFLVKFNSAGIRQWGTFYGGSGCEWAEGIDLDNFGNIYMTGGTTSQTAIVTPGCHQATIGVYFDAFLVKFNSSGVRQWATYYGGNAYDNGECCKVNSSGDIFLMGYTLATNTVFISTPGSYQTNYGGGSGDSYIAKFNSSGVRQWGTYYGGPGDDWFGHFCLDTAGDLYLPGSSSSTTGTVIATPGTHQPNYGGGIHDAFLAKFSSAGNRLWCTYYGGSGDDIAYNLSLDANSNVYLSGHTSTSSGTSIATECTYQYVYGGGASDAFLAKFTSSGTRLWGTYYGGTGREDDFWAVDNISDSQGNVYLCGTTTSPTGTVIASGSSHQPLFSGGISDAFLVKFNGCTPVLPASTTPSQNLVICFGQNTSLTTNTLDCGIKWYQIPGGSVIGTGSVLPTPTLASNTTFFIGDLSCGPANSLTPVTVTVNPLPNISINANNTLVCSGTQINLNAIGAINYTWTPGASNSASLSFSPTASISYSVEGGDGLCNNTATILIDVVPVPTLTLNYLSGPYCYSTVVTFSASGAQSYSWFPAGSLSAVNNSVATSVPLEANATFTLIGSNTNGIITCLNDKIFSLNVLQTLSTQISNSIIICEGEKTNLNASGGNIYHWLPEENINNPSLSFVTVNPAATTIYSVGISYNNLCPQTRTVLVHVVPTPFVSAGNDTTINIGDPVNLTASGDGIIKWISGESMSCYDCRVTNIFPFTRTCYEVELTDQNGCKAVDDVCVEIINDFDLYIPNTFTPNNDGMNDVFEISYYGIKEIKLIIYDRWGVKLFATNDLKNNWDGIYNGKICQVGTYVYKLEYEPYKGKSGERIGHVNLVR